MSHIPHGRSVGQKGGCSEGPGHSGPIQTDPESSVRCRRGISARDRNISGTPENALATLVNNDTRDPKNWTEAMESKDKLKWMAGMDKEMNSIKS